jgi:hypothetical protein
VRRPEVLRGRGSARRQAPATAAARFFKFKQSPVIDKVWILKYKKDIY